MWIPGVPGVIFHGDADLRCPLDMPHEVDLRWPDGRLVVLDGAGHGAGPEMTGALIAALDRLAAATG